MSETIHHPELGELRWEEEWSWWFTQIEGPDGRLDIIIDPGDGDRAAYIDRAAELYHWAMGAQWRLLREAVEVKLLDLYNNNWRNEDEPVLSAKELADRLQWDGLRLDAGDDPTVPVSFGYVTDDDLFGGHLVNVEVDRELQYRGAHLEG
jgi:hypothetical protein